MTKEAGYIKLKNDLLIRLNCVYRAIVSPNFIMVYDIKKTFVDGQPATSSKYACRTNFNTTSDRYALLGVAETLNKYEEPNI